MTAAKFGALLDRLSAKTDCLGKAPFEVIGGSQRHVKYRVLRIVRAHTNGQLAMGNRLLTSASEGQRQSHISMGGSKIRVEFECALELLDCLIGRPFRIGNKAERQVRPWVTVVERYRSCGKHFRLANLRFQISQCPSETARHQEHECHHAVRWPVIRITLDRTPEYGDRGVALGLGQSPEQ